MSMVPVWGRRRRWFFRGGRCLRRCLLNFLFRCLGHSRRRKQQMCLVDRSMSLGVNGLRVRANTLHSRFWKDKGRFSRMSLRSLLVQCKGMIELHVPMGHQRMLRGDRGSRDGNLGLRLEVEQKDRVGIMEEMVMGSASEGRRTRDQGGTLIMS